MPSTAGGAVQRPARTLHGCRNPSTSTSTGCCSPSPSLGLGSLTVEGQSTAPRLCSLDQPTAGWRSITAVVDSGAEETVAPPGLFPGQVEESPMQRAGGRYRAANGSRLPNLGQQLAAFRTPEGRACSLRFQIAGVEHPLISVAQLARTGHRVEFGAEDGHIVHVPSGQRVRLQRDGGVYILRMLVRDPGASAPARLPQSIDSSSPSRAKEVNGCSSGFSRPRQ